MSSKKSSRTILGVTKTSLIVRGLECTPHAIFRSATNLSENDLSLERTKDDDTKFDWKPLTYESWKPGIPAPTIYIHNTSTMADQTIGGVHYVVKTYAKPDILNHLEGG